MFLLWVVLLAGEGAQELLLQGEHPCPDPLCNPWVLRVVLALHRGLRDGTLLSLRSSDGKSAPKAITRGETAGHKSQLSGGEGVLR